MQVKIVRASISYLDKVTDLFDSYRQFYEQKSDIEGATTFIENRLKNDESVIFLAETELAEPLGFVQLYPSFSSVSMKKVWYLNDLFIDKDARNKGVARALLKHVKSFAKETGAQTVKLTTAVSNEKAKLLYESEGYLKNTTFDHYAQNIE